MADNIFQTVSMKAGDTEKSYNWYREQVKNLGSNLSGTQILRNEKLTSRIRPGEMYLFMYDPKLKKTLPYYDAVPLVLPFQIVKDGFLGINLHYLPYLARFNLLGELNKLTLDKRITENTRIQISWQILNSSSKYLAATACVKHYLTAHLRSRFLKINYTDWITASMLPVERFKSDSGNDPSKAKVWRDTSKKI
jgi:hypothetical protein